MSSQTKADLDLEHLERLARRGGKLEYEDKATPEALSRFADKHKGIAFVKEFDDFPLPVRAEAAAAYLHVTGGVERVSDLMASKWTRQILRDIEERKPKDERDMSGLSSPAMGERTGDFLTKAHMGKIRADIELNHQDWDRSEIRNTVGVYVIASTMVAEREARLAQDPLNDALFDGDKRYSLSLRTSEMQRAATNGRQNEMEKMCKAYMQSMGPSRRELRTMERKLGQMSNLLKKNGAGDVEYDLAMKKRKIEAVASSEDIAENVDVFDRLKAGSPLSRYDHKCLAGGLYKSCVDRVVEEGHGLEDVCLALKDRTDVPPSILRDFRNFQHVLGGINTQKPIKKQDIVKKMMAFHAKLKTSGFPDYEKEEAAFKSMNERFQKKEDVPAREILKACYGTARCGKRQAVYYTFLADRLTQEERAQERGASSSQKSKAGDER